MGALQKTLRSNRTSVKLDQLEKEIGALETELVQVEKEINAFTSLIRAALAEQIRHLNQLTDLYKARKLAKKEKRLEQKKRGKNYRETTFELTPSRVGVIRFEPNSARLVELKRLYKEAIVRVHPDKFATEDSQTADRATEVTSQLVSLYQSGELDALRDFHEYILSGNAMEYVPFARKETPDPQSLLIFLQKKHVELSQKVEEIKSSRFYEVLTTYPNPETFIEELRLAYTERIQIMQKRTRK